MRLQPGDRFRVASGPSKKCIGLCGTIKGSGPGTGYYATMDLKDARKIDPTSDGKGWHFASGWKLELIDDSKSYIPEDWS